MKSAAAAILYAISFFSFSQLGNVQEKADTSGDLSKGGVGQK
jgi:hypothetical protein